MSKPESVTAAYLRREAADDPGKARAHVSVWQDGNRLTDQELPDGDTDSLVKAATARLAKRYTVGPFVPPGTDDPHLDLRATLTPRRVGVLALGHPFDPRNELHLTDQTVPHPRVI